METVNDSYRYSNDGIARQTETLLLLSKTEAKPKYDDCPANGTASLNPKIRNDKIPALVWMAMKIACVFYHKNITGKRLCFRCKIHESQEYAKLTGQKEDLIKYLASNYIDPVSLWYELPDVKRSAYKERYALLEIEEDKERTSSCKYCDIYWWNYDGDVEKYNDDSIGAKRWNHSGSWLLSLLTICGTLTVLVYHIIYRIFITWWGVEDKLFHTIAYGVFMMNLMLYPALSLCSKLMSAFRGIRPRLSWATAINARYIVKRLQYIGFLRDGIPGKLLLILCNFLPFIIASYRAYMYVNVLKIVDKHSVSSVLFGGIVMWMWGNFQYLLYLTRLSFQRQFLLVTRFIESHTDDLESCLLVIGNAVQDFNCYRKFIVIYMTLFVSINSWAITTQVTWQYLLLKNTQADKLDCRIPQSFKYLNILYWSTLSFFIILGIWSVGGFDVTTIFEEFRVNIVSLKRKSTYKVWKRLVQQVDDVSSVPRGGVIKSTMILSVINFYLALKIGEEQTDFTDISVCNIVKIVTEHPT